MSVFGNIAVALKGNEASVIVDVSECDQRVIEVSQRGQTMWVAADLNRRVTRILDENEKAEIRVLRKAISVDALTGTKRLQEWFRRMR